MNTQQNIPKLYIKNWVFILQIDQMQLALPSRDYYLKSISRGDLDAYHTYMTNIAIIIGANQTTVREELKDVLDLEIALANVSKT